MSFIAMHERGHSLVVVILGPINKKIPSLRRLIELSFLLFGRMPSLVHIKMLVKDMPDHDPFLIVSGEHRAK